MKRWLAGIALGLPGVLLGQQLPPNPVPAAVNALGIDLLGAQPPSGGNWVISPYSIEQALAMAWTGADGQTRAEMGRVLHLPDDGSRVQQGFSTLESDLARIRDESAQLSAEAKAQGNDPGIPDEVDVANRLFVQTGLGLLRPFVQAMADGYGTSVQELDFKHSSAPARGIINQWVAEHTREKILDIVPPGGVDANTRIAIADAIYFRAAWPHGGFDPLTTEPEPFYVRGIEARRVPTMRERSRLGYLHRGDFMAISLPYDRDDLRFLILLPDARDGLPALEREITPELLAKCAGLIQFEVTLHLPKFRMTPIPVALGQQLRSLGMKAAFDDPPGSADFSRMAPRPLEGTLALSDIFHDAYISVDEKGTEAAAATVVTLMTFGVQVDPKPPKELWVDHPFLFAVQHLPDGACLFLGRVVDPR